MLIILILLILLIYIFIGCLIVTFLDKFEPFKCKSLDEKLMQGVFWPIVLFTFLIWFWCKFCIKISKKILKQ